METMKTNINTTVETAKTVFQGVLNQGNLNSLIKTLTYRNNFYINDILTEFLNIFRKS